MRKKKLLEIAHSLQELEVEEEIRISEYKIVLKQRPKDITYRKLIRSLYIESVIMKYIISIAENIIFVIMTM